ncbi:hypothetical protein ACJRO7_024046 [Eucalyptus globulus]|uniref:Phytocyanin domain-containing protein n=1 Tax=Eucalyptus globulus TaxID=34317 RepID=A0ABD3K405_EUCGL
MAGLRYAGIVLLVMAATMAMTEARTIIVGGSENWCFGHNYMDRDLKNTFKFDHDVYLLPNLFSYLKCNFRGVVLDPWRLYYFVSFNDKDCSDSLMKFFAIPLPRWQ